MRPTKTSASRPFNLMSRRAAVTGAALAAMTVLAGCGAKGAAPAEGDMALGAAEGARVTVVEYASVTCGHCAAWQAEVWPAFKAKYVDTNQVRYVFREFPTSPVEVATAGFLVARCAGPDRYFDVVEELMASQNAMVSGQPRAVLLRVAQGVGLSEEQFQRCVSDPAAIQAMESRIRAGLDAGVNGTPTFLINGEKAVDITLSGLSGKIDAALAK